MDILERPNRNLSNSPVVCLLVFTGPLSTNFSTAGMNQTAMINDMTSPIHTAIPKFSRSGISANSILPKPMIVVITAKPTADPILVTEMAIASSTLQPFDRSSSYLLITWIP